MARFNAANLSSVLFYTINFLLACHKPTLPKFLKYWKTKKRPPFPKAALRFPNLILRLRCRGRSRRRGRGVVVRWEGIQTEFVALGGVGGIDGREFQVGGVLDGQDVFLEVGGVGIRSGE